MTTSYASHARALTDALGLTLTPVAVSLTDTVPAGVPAFAGRVPAGCVFWQEAAARSFATSPADHELCAIGTFTHNLDAGAAHEEDRRDALRVFADLGYVRPEEVPLIPALRQRRRHVVYGPLPDAPLAPDAVVLFVRAGQTLVLVEACERVDGGTPPAMGRPACAVVPQVVNSGRAALSLGCCGARAYVDAMTEDVAIFAMPGGRLAEYTAQVTALARANSVLGRFHRLRRADVEAGGRPTVMESVARLGS